jgi:hypothetical protein
MPTNVYFNNYGSTQEKRLVEDLMVEAIKIYGVDCYYVPNINDSARDLIYGEDPLKKFNAAYPLELYVQNVDGYGNEREFFSKFGLEIRNGMTVIVSKRSFSRWVPQTYRRPREGDLIYIPFLSQTGELYEIKYVDYSDSFYVLGNKFPYFYKLELEKFKYSQETISTGVFNIDDTVTQSAYTITMTLNGGGSGVYQNKEIVYQSPDGTKANATVVAIVKDWRSTSNTLSVTNIAGEFANNNTIIGATSNARYSAVATNLLTDNTRNEVYDNSYVSNEATSIKNITEINPFGDI